MIAPEMIARKPANVTGARTAAGTPGGFSLIELMISITIGLVLLLGFAALLLNQSKAREELEKSARQIENGRYAMQLLHDDIEHAGFYGQYSPASGVTYTLPADPCVTAFGAANSGWDNTPLSVPVAVSGYVGGATDPTAGTTCRLDHYQPQTAILVVRRATTDMVSTTAASAATTYIQASGCNNDNNRFFVYGTGAPVGNFILKQKDCATLALLSPYVVNVYYISSCDVCVPSDNIPTLKMVRSGPNTTPDPPIPLAEGVENMQFAYGIDTTGSGAPDTFVAAPGPTDVADWQNVMSVKVSLLARNIDPTTGYTDTKTYDLDTGGIVGPFSAAAACVPANYPQLCNYKRHLYSAQIRVVNPSGRRETP